MRAASVCVRLEAIHLTTDQVQPIGLILNEVVSNAIKHAFPDNGTGRIEVSLKAVGDDEAELVISDNGVGMPFAPKVGMGTRLVQNLVKQLEGAVSLSTDIGSTFELRFPAKRAP